MTKCPYFKENFCIKAATAIDQNGMCNVIWRKGKQRKINHQELQPCRNFTVYDTSFEEYDEKKQKEKKEILESIERRKKYKIQRVRRKNQQPYKPIIKICGGRKK